MSAFAKLRLVCVLVPGNCLMCAYACIMLNYIDISYRQDLVHQIIYKRLDNYKK